MLPGDPKTVGLTCPFRDDSEEEGVLCFDPWLDEYGKPPEHIIEGWCNSNYLECPIYVSFQRTMALRVDSHLA
ncbi:MAG: hypothetical protein AABZ64_08820 [Nitrospinota bacterium]